MISNFYITKSDIINPDEKDFSLLSCKLTAQIQENAASVKDIIKNIETFNDNKPRNKRMKYSLYADGVNMPIYVAKSKFIENESYIFIYAYNGRGSMYVNTNENKNINLVDGITTFMFPIEKITGINFGSFNATDCEFLLNNKSDDMTEDKITSLIVEEISTLNSLISCGEYRNAIIHFCLFMKNNKINSFDFNYNSTAFNKYIMLCGIYLNLIKDIVGRHDDHTININNPKLPNKMYFFTNKEEMEEFLKTAEHTRMNINDNNTFYEEDITLYKQILSNE